MDKKFIENCKLLKRHFTKLTQADTTTQSINTNFADENAAKNIIDDAKKLLLSEQIEELSNEDIALLKEKSVNRFAKELQTIESKQTYRLCKKENVKWDHEIFVSPLPHPKYNADYLKFQKVNIDTEIENERKEIEELTNILYNFESSDRSKQCNSKKMKTELNKTQNEKKLIEEKGANHFKEKEQKVDFELENNSNYPSNNAMKKENVTEEKFKSIKATYVQIPNYIEENCIEITDVPELKVTPQKNKKVEFLEVKKINIEDKENTANFDMKEEKDAVINKEILSHTIIKWKKYTKQSKNAKTNAHSKKIDHFLENLQKFQLATANKSKSDLTNKNSQNTEVITTKIKPKSSTCLETKISSYEHRFKAQKDIIEMQKEKLMEQNKLIEELKLNKIKKDARFSLEKASEMKKIILSPIKYKCKPKSELKSETHESEKNENELNLTLNFNKAPKIVKMMEERAKERHERRLLILERKRIIEEEKKRQAEEIVQRKLKEETEEKQKRLEKMKKHRHLVRQMELKKQLEKKRYIKLNETANEHYKTKLKNFGLQYFKMLIYDIKIKTEIAKRFYENNIIITCFKSWRNFSSNILDNKNKLAINLYRKKLLEKFWSCWKSYQFEMIQSKQVAIDRYEMSLQTKCFIEWHKLVCENRVQYMIDAQKADRYFRRTLLYHCFEQWRSLPAIMQIERVQNERKRKWRLRVAEILSDYDPLKNYDYKLMN